MMQAEEIARAFRRKVSGEVKVAKKGLDRFIVYTPFSFDDGDHFVIIMKREGDKWLLTDEGHTFMHLSYGDVDLTTGTRAQIIDSALTNYGVENHSGELRLAIPRKEFGDTLFTFVQALARIASTASWTQEKVKSTFFEDVTALIEETVPMGRALPKYTDPQVDPDGKYPADYLIRGATREWFVFAVSNDTQCQQAMITSLWYENHKKRNPSIVMYENQMNIARRFVAQLTDVTDKAFSSLSDRSRIKHYLEEEVLAAR